MHNFHNQQLRLINSAFENLVASRCPACPLNVLDSPCFGPKRIAWLSMTLHNVRSSLSVQSTPIKCYLSSSEPVHSYPIWWGVQRLQRLLRLGLHTAIDPLDPTISYSWSAFRLLSLTGPGNSLHNEKWCPKKRKKQCFHPNAQTSCYFHEGSLKLCKFKMSIAHSANESGISFWLPKTCWRRCGIDSAFVARVPQFV